MNNTIIGDDMQKNNSDAPVKFFLGASGKVQTDILKLKGDDLELQKTNISFNQITTNGLTLLKGVKTDALKKHLLGNTIHVGTDTHPNENDTSITSLKTYARSEIGKYKHLEPLGSINSFKIDNYEGSGRTLVVSEYILVALFAPIGSGGSVVYTEVGIGPNVTAPTNPNTVRDALHTYAIFKNTAGTVAEPIEVQDDEYLRVTYTYQIQEFLMDGFLYNKSIVPPLAKDDTIYGSGVKPIGPITMTGEGWDGVNNAYVFLNSHGNSTATSNTSFGGVFYVEESNLATVNDHWNPSLLEIPKAQMLNTNPTGVYAFNNPTSGWAASMKNIMESLHSNLTGLIKLKSGLNNKEGSTYSFEPGELVSTAGVNIYVMGFGSGRSGGFILFEKPIKVDWDMRFTCTNNLMDLWDFVMPINSTFLEEP